MLTRDNLHLYAQKSCLNSRVLLLLNKLTPEYLPSGNGPYLGAPDIAERRRQQEAQARAIANEKKLAKRRSHAIRAGFSSPL